MKKKKIITICSVVTAAVLLFCAAGGVLIHHLYTNTYAFDSLKDDFEKAEDVYEDVLADVNITDESDTERARILYGAILSNESITNSEKKTLLSFIQYFADNKYIDCEAVSQRLSEFTITENDPSLLDIGAGAEYKSENTITFADDEYRESSLSHELHHCVENPNLDYEYYSWFGEGFTCLVNYEYFDVSSESHNLQTYFVRALGDIVGSECLFEVSGTGNIDVLTNALVERGIDENLVNEVYVKFEELKMISSTPEDVSVDQRMELIDMLVDMYITANGSEDGISYSFYYATRDFLGFVEEPYEYYYLNSTKINFTGQLKNVSVDDFSALYKDAENYCVVF